MFKSPTPLAIEDPASHTEKRPRSTTIALKPIIIDGFYEDGTRAESPLIDERGKQPLLPGTDQPLKKKQKTAPVMMPVLSPMCRFPDGAASIPIGTAPIPEVERVETSEPAVAVFARSASTDSLLWGREGNVALNAEVLEAWEWEKEAEKLELWMSRCRDTPKIITHLKERINFLQAGLDKLIDIKEFCDTLKKERDDAKDQAVRLSLEKSNLEKAISSLKEDITILKQEAETAMMEYESLKSQFDLMERERNDACKQADGLNIQLKETKTFYAGIEEELNRLRREVNEWKASASQQAMATYNNVMEQVRFLNPTARLENVSPLHLVRDGQLMSIDNEGNLFPVDRQSFMDTEPTIEGDINPATNPAAEGSTAEGGGTMSLG